MNNRQIIWIVDEFVDILQHRHDLEGFEAIELNNRTYAESQINDFIHDVIEVGNKHHVIFLQNAIQPDHLISYIKDLALPLLVFEKKGERLIPVSIYNKSAKEREIKRFYEDKVEKAVDDLDIDDLHKDESGNILLLAAFQFDSLVSDPLTETGEGEKPSPIERLFRLLSTEKKDIFYIYIYAIFIGMISLALPLGVQAIIGRISGGMLFSSVGILIGLVVIAILIGGGLQVMQLSLVEILERRVFSKAAYEFAFRIPRIKAESIYKYHAPELMNRFFDILTIQKGLPKLLIDVSSAGLQIIFGLILLAFYHPFFVFFGLGLLLVLGVIFYVTGPKGLHSSMTESKYKYKVAFWLEEMARTINSFKMAGNTNLPIRRTDKYVNSYLTYRNKHFQVLISQFRYIIIFKTFVTGGLLIIGAILVLDRQITLGQFVASEIVIILIVNAVEKVIMYMDTVYDMLTAVEKIGAVTDLPLEKSGGVSIPKEYLKNGVQIKVRNLKYKFPESNGWGLSGVSLDVKAGEKIAITGFNGSGKSTLTSILAGIYTNYEGTVAYNNIPLCDLDLINLRDQIAKNVSQEDIFDGTILENIVVGKPNSGYVEALAAAEKAGVLDFIQTLPDGFNTEIISGGKNFSNSIVQKIILARCIAKDPGLLILNDFFINFQKSEKERLIKMLTNKEERWTLVAVTNDPLILAACDKIIVLDKGQVVDEGQYSDLHASGRLSEIIEVRA